MTDEILESVLAPTLSDLVDKGSFQEVLQNYQRLFDLTVRVFDRPGNLIAEAAKTVPVCGHFCHSEAGKKLCIATRMKVKRLLPETKRLLSVECLSGLRYTLAPIAFQGDVIGKLVLGPYRPGEPRNHVDGPAVPADDQVLVDDTVAQMRSIPTSLIRKIAASMLSVLDAILFSAHKALLTSEMHIASVRDAFETITEKNRTLEEMTEKMKAFDRMKSNFLSTVSHELRTPLTSIIGYSDLLSEGIAGALDEEQQQFVDTIKVKGEELLKLISTILDFSQIETGHLTISPASVDVRTLVENTVSQVRENAEKRGVPLSCAIDDELGAVSLDADKIQTALSHLIDNAVKFSPPGSVVRVSAGISESDIEDDDNDAGFVLMAAPTWLVITVQDFGQGIDADNQEAIFAPFSQLDNSTTREHGGAGLGLALVKQFVEAHGGSISVSSVLNEGSRFTVRLPILATAES
jgi:two-component system, NarL family, sensor histidine kinase BarA